MCLYITLVCVEEEVGDKKFLKENKEMRRRKRDTKIDKNERGQGCKNNEAG